MQNSLISQIRISLLVPIALCVGVTLPAPAQSGTAQGISRPAAAVPRFLARPASAIQGLLPGVTSRQAASVVSTAVVVEKFSNGNDFEVDLPSDVTFSNDGKHVIVSSMGITGRPNLSVYDAGSLKLVAAFPLAEVPTQIKAIPGTTRLLIANAHADTLFVMDYVTGMAIATIPVGEAPSWLMVSSDGSFAWTATAGNVGATVETWSRVDLLTFVETARIAGGPPGSGNTTLGSFGSTKAYFEPHFSVNETVIFAQQDNQIVKLDLASLTWSTVYSFPKTGFWGVDFDVTSDGSTVVAMFEDFNTFTVSMIVVDTATGTAVAHPLNEFGINFGRTHLSPDGTKVVGTGLSGLHQVEIVTGVVTQLDTSSFFFNPFYDAKFNVNGGNHFVLMDSGIAEAPGNPVVIYNWSTGQVDAKIFVPELKFDSTLAVLFALNPADDSQMALVDGLGAFEEVAVLNLDSAQPGGIHRQLGDDVEGDRAFDLDMAAGGTLAMISNAQSNNAQFADLKTGTTFWLDTLEGQGAAALTKDGQFAVFTSGLDNVVMVYELSTQTSTIISFGAATDRARMITLDRNQPFGYFVVDRQGLGLSDLMRVDLLNKSIDLVSIALDGFHASSSPLGTGLGVSAPVFMDDQNRQVSQSPDGKTLIVHTHASDFSGGQVTFVDTTTWSKVGSAKLPATPLQTIYSKDGQTTYLLTEPQYLPPNFLPQVSVLKMTGTPAAPSLAASVTLGGAVQLAGTMALSPDGSKLYVGVRLGQSNPLGFVTDSIRVIDTQTFTELPSISLPVLDDFDGAFKPGTFLHVNEPMHLLFTRGCQGSTLWIFSMNGEVHRIDTASSTVTQSYFTGLRGISGVHFDRSSALSSPRFLVAGSSYLAESAHNWDGAAWLTLGVECP